MSVITIRQAFEQFSEIAESIPSDDTVMLCEAWNDYTDSLCKDGELTDLQYNHCPAADEEMPGEYEDDDADFLLDAMGVRFFEGVLRAKRDDGIVPDMPRNFECTFSRGEKEFKAWYSQGAAHTEPPTMSDVLHSMMKDAAPSDSDFDDWCDEYGYDTDSRKAYATWEACKEAGRKLDELFTEDELNDLREVMEGR